MGKLAPGLHCARPPLPGQERMDLAALEMTWNTWDYAVEPHSCSQLTYAEFLCHVVHLEAVRRHADHSRNGGRKA